MKTYNRREKRVRPKHYKKWGQSEIFPVFEYMQKNNVSFYSAGKIFGVPVVTLWNWYNREKDNFPALAEIVESRYTDSLKRAWDASKKEKRE